MYLWHREEVWSRGYEIICTQRTRGKAIFKEDKMEISSRDGLEW